MGSNINANYVISKLDANGDAYWTGTAWAPSLSDAKLYPNDATAQFIYERDIKPHDDARVHFAMVY